MTTSLCLCGKKVSHRKVRREHEESMFEIFQVKMKNMFKPEVTFLFERKASEMS